MLSKLVRVSAEKAPQLVVYYGCAGGGADAAGGRSIEGCLRLCACVYAVVSLRGECTELLCSGMQSSGALTKLKLPPDTEVPGQLWTASTDPHSLLRSLDLLSRSQVLQIERRMAGSECVCDEFCGQLSCAS